MSIASTGLGHSETPRTGKRPSVPVTERIACTINDACAISGLGRTTIYDLIGQKKIETAKVGGRRLIVVASLARLIEQSRAA